MKIVVVCAGGYVSGKEIMSLHLLRNLKAKGYECSCIVSSWNNGDFISRLKDLGIEYYQLRLGFISTVFQFAAMRMNVLQLLHLPALLWAFKKIKRDNGDALYIHTNFHHVSLLSSVLPRRNIYWSHEILTDRGIYRSLFRLMMKRNFHFVCVSKAVEKSLTTLGVNRRIQTITNGIPKRKFVDDQTRPKADIINLAIAGQVAPHKGHRLLIDAISKASNKNLIRLYIVGAATNSFCDELKSLIAERHITELVSWKGFVKDTDEIYKDIDFVVVPSLKPDPYPTTVLEACWRGIPVITSNSGGLEEMVLEGVNGFKFPAGDVDKLKNILESITKSSLKRASVFNYAEQFFQESVFVKKFELLFLEIYNGS
jgi:glycosyltransferase involved in cell wall biosynthesis